MTATAIDLSAIKTDALSAASTFRTLIGLGTLATQSPTGTANSTTYLRGDFTWQTISGGGTWGSITGTLSSQTDLQSALDAKASLSGATFTGRITTQSILLSGNYSSTAWTTSGVGLSHTARTLTDTSSTGTVATAYTNVLGGNTIAASNATTFTDYASLFLGSPTAGTNVTITNAFSLITQGAARFGGAVGINAGTLNGTVLDIAQTWGGTGTYTGIRYNVTDSGPSNAASLLMDLQVGGSSKFKVNKAGRLNISGGGGGSATDVDIGYAGVTNYGIMFGNGVRSVVNGVISTWSSPSGLQVNGAVAWTDAGAVGNITTQLVQDAFFVLALRNGTNANTFRIYNTTDAGLNNYERAKIAWESNVLKIGTEGLGTGAVTPRAMEFQTAGTTRLTIDGSGNTTVANGFLYFQDTNGYVSRTTATNTMNFSASGGSVHMSLFGAWLVLYTNGILGRSGSTGGIQQTFTYGVNDRGGNTGAGHITRLSGGNGSTATTGSAGGNAEILGGSANGTGNNNGGNVLLDGGAATGTGVNGSFVIGSVRSTLTCFAGTTSSFPAIKRNSAALNFRLADDSADCDITAKAATFSGNLTVSAVNLVTDTTTGTKIGTGTTQKLGFYNSTPVVQPAAVADATDAASVITQLNLLLARMRDLGLIAT